MSGSSKRPILGALLLSLLMLGVFFGALTLTASSRRPEPYAPNRPYPFGYFIPEQGTGTFDRLVTFGWCTLKNKFENFHSFLLQVFTFDPFSIAISVRTTEGQFTSKDPLPDGTYYWRVLAVDAKNQAEWLWDGMANFTIYTSKSGGDP